MSLPEGVDPPGEPLLFPLFDGFEDEGLAEETFPG